MGCGKTELASQFPKALIASFERGSNALHHVYVQPMKTWSDWKASVKQLLQKPELKDKFYTICMDTADEAYKLCERYLCQQYSVNSIREVAGYGQGYKMLDEAFMTPFRDLSYAGYGLVFISHSKDKPDPTETNPEHTKAKPALPDRPFDLINKMVDMVGYIRAEDTPDGEKRFIYFRDSKDFMAKSRFKYIKPRVEFSYDNIVEAIYEAIDETVAREGGQSTDSESPYEQRSFDELMDEARNLWGQVVAKDKLAEASKILENEFGKPTKFSEIMPEQISQLERVLFEVREIL